MSKQVPSMPNLISAHPIQGFPFNNIPQGKIPDLAVRAGVKLVISMATANTEQTNATKPPYQGQFKYLLVIQAPQIPIYIRIDPPNGQLYEIDQLTFMDFSNLPPKGFFIYNDLTSATPLVLYVSNIPISNLAPSAAGLVDSPITANTITAPTNSPGTAWVRLQGTGGVATANVGGAGALNLNGGSALANGALYEFKFHIEGGESIVIAGCTFLKALFIAGAV